MTYKTYKQRFNINLGLHEDTEHSLKELEKITSIPIKILKEVDKRGIAAYHNNFSSVRLKNDFTKNSDLRRGPRLSAKQWSKARVYAFIFKSIFQNMKYKKQDLDLYEQIKHIYVCMI